MKHMTDYESDLHEWLKPQGNADAYLNAVLEEGDKSAMLLALREVWPRLTVAWQQSLRNRT